jgi:hypothetical protein
LDADLEDLIKKATKERFKQLTSSANLATNIVIITLIIYILYCTAPRNKNEVSALSSIIFVDRIMFLRCVYVVVVATADSQYGRKIVHPSS